MSKRILIIEDDAASREMYQEILSFEGLNVSSAGDGIEAIKVLELNLPFDLILMDLTFPRGTPHEVNQTLKKLNHQTPIIILSGKENIAQIGQEIQAIDLLKKPFDLDQFVDTVKKHL